MNQLLYVLENEVNSDVNSAILTRIISSYSHLLSSISIYFDKTPRKRSKNKWMKKNILKISLHFITQPARPESICERCSKSREDKNENQINKSQATHCIPKKCIMLLLVTETSKTSWNKMTKVYYDITSQPIGIEYSTLFYRWLTRVGWLRDSCTASMPARGSNQSHQLWVLQKINMSILGISQASPAVVSYWNWLIPRMTHTKPQFEHLFSWSSLLKVPKNAARKWAMGWSHNFKISNLDTNRYANLKTGFWSIEN